MCAIAMFPWRAYGAGFCAMMAGFPIVHGAWRKHAPWAPLHGAPMARCALLCVTDNDQGNLGNGARLQPAAIGPGMLEC